MKKCPFCAEQIQDEAIKCRYCGSMLAGAPETPRFASADPLDDRVRLLLQERRKIEAIKLVRQHTGLGLKEAKDYVERFPGASVPGSLAKSLVFWGVLVVVAVTIWWLSISSTGTP